MWKDMNNKWENLLGQIRTDKSVNLLKRLRDMAWEWVEILTQIKLKNRIRQELLVCFKKVDLKRF